MSRIGTVLKIKRKAVKVMTNQNDLVRVNKKPGMYVGQRIHFEDSDIFKPGKTLTKFLLASTGAVAAVILSLWVVSHYLSSKNLTVSNNPQDSQTAKPDVASVNETKEERKPDSDNKLPVKIKETSKNKEIPMSKNVDAKIPDVSEINKDNDNEQPVKPKESNISNSVPEKLQIKPPVPTVVLEPKSSVIFEPDPSPIVEPTPTIVSEPKPNTLKELEPSIVPENKETPVQKDTSSESEINASIPQETKPSIIPEEKPTSTPTIEPNPNQEPNGEAAESNNE